jgi:hypothetical protein
VLAECDSFRQTLEVAAKLRQQVTVLDVHMDDERAVTPSELKSSLNGSCMLAISIWRDNETKVFAASIGAVKLTKRT